VTLALGIAVTNTVFTIVNTAILRDVPFDEPDRLVLLTTVDGRGRGSAVSYLDYRDWRESTRTLAGLAASSGTPMSVSDEGRPPERIRGSYVTANLFSLLGRAPVLGRDFLPEDDSAGAAPVVILNHSLWQNRFGGDRNILGRSIRVNDMPATVVGVMPQGFRFPFSEDVWLPLSASPAVSASRNARNLYVFGRLADSATREDARAELETVAARLSRDYPGTNTDVRPIVATMKGEFIESTRPILTTFLAAVGLVLLIACANVANLLLSRSALRSREFAIRASLGATRWRIVRQLLIESTVLSMGAGIVGVILSGYGVAFLGVAFDGREPGAPLGEARTPYWVDLGMDSTVYTFVVAACLLTSLLSGLAPAIHASKKSTVDALKSGGRGVAGLGAGRWASTFMVVQVSLALVLLTGAGLLVRNFLQLYFADRVINTAGVVTARLTLPVQKYAGPDDRRRFLGEFEGRLSSTTLFTAATMSSDVPFTFANTQRVVSIEGQPDTMDRRLPISVFLAGRQYFETLGLPIVRGRALGRVDESKGQLGAVVNQRFASSYFPDSDPVGRRVRLSGIEDPFTIVGVSATMPFSAPPQRQGEDSAVYIQLFGAPPPGTVSVIVRSAADVQGVATRLREELKAIDPGLPLHYAQTLDDVFANNRFAVRLMGGWFGFLAAIAVVLASVGLYALTAQAVAQRTQEIGIRMALGAEARQVVGLFLRRSMVQLFLGLVLGLAGALAAGQLIQRLPGTQARDPLTLVLATTLLVLVAAIATVVPARRAARVDPLTALRYE
jgi:predicted permease